MAHKKLRAAILYKEKIWEEIEKDIFMRMICFMHHPL